MVFNVKFEGICFALDANFVFMLAASLSLIQRALEQTKSLKVGRFYFASGAIVIFISKPKGSNGHGYLHDSLPQFSPSNSKEFVY